MTADNITFAQLLTSELELTSALHQLLEQELAALQEQAMEPLSALQHTKSELLQQLQHQSQQRLDWMTQQQLPHSKECLERPDFAADEQLNQLWQQLGDGYEKNQQLSRVLGQIVLTARKRSIDLLNILHGKQNDPHLYNSNGKASGLNQGLGYTRA